MVSEFLGVLQEATVASSCGIVLTLLTRKPARRLFGPSLAYLLWLLVPAACLALLPPLPSIELPALPIPLSVHSLTGNFSLVSVSSGRDWAAWLLVGWGIGALMSVLSLVRQQMRFTAGLGELRPRSGVFRAACVSGCPAVIGLLRPKIVVPVDFDIRYAPVEQELILDHERMHLRRGDLMVNALWAAARCALWFNPLLHIAARLIRIDQELACDAAVMRHHPESRKSYARAMLKTQLTEAAMPLGCHWRSIHPLKERIMLLNQPSPRGFRRAAGQWVIGVMVFTVGCGAWAVEPRRAEPAADNFRTSGADSGISISADSAQKSGDGVRYTGKVVIGILNSSGRITFKSDSAHALPGGKILMEGNVQVKGDGWRFTTEKVIVEHPENRPIFKMDEAQAFYESSQSS